MKKLITLLLIAAMASTTAMAQDFAENDIMLINEEAEAQQMFVKFNVTDAEVYEEDTVKYVKGIDENENEIRFVLSDNTVIVNEKGEKAEIANGAVFTAFVGWDTPAPLVLPPIYTPDAIVIDTDEELTADADVFNKEDDRYVNETNTLAISADPANIIDEDGNAYTGDIDGKEVVVIYGITTRSIPPMAVAEKVIVLDDAENEEVIPEEKVTAVKVGDKKFDIENKNGFGMLPVRAVSEALGLEVDWNGNLKAITVGTVQMGVNFRIGENAYRKAKMTAFTLESAPVSEQTEAGGVTYVPVSFFTELLECEAETADGVMTLTRA